MTSMQAEYQTMLNSQKQQAKIEHSNSEAEKDRIESLMKEGSIDPIEMKKEIQQLMWEKVSIVRNEQNLKSALERLLEMKEELKDLNVDDRTQFNESLLTALEVINMVEICILTVKSAILRRESRGAHFRSDFPESKDEWKKSIVINKNKIEFEAR